MKTNLMKLTVLGGILLFSAGVFANNFQGAMSYQSRANPSYAAAGYGGQQMAPGSLMARQPGAVQVAPRGVGEHQAYASTARQGCAPRGGYSSIEGPIRNGAVMVPSTREHR